MPFSIQRSCKGKSPDIRKEREEKKKIGHCKEKKVLLNVAMVSQVEAVNVWEMTKRVRFEVSRTSDGRQTGGWGDKELDGRTREGVRKLAAASQHLSSGNSNPPEARSHCSSVRAALPIFARSFVRTQRSCTFLVREGWETISRVDESIWSWARHVLQTLQHHVQRKHRSASRCFLSDLFLGRMSPRSAPRFIRHPVTERNRSWSVTKLSSSVATQHGFPSSQLSHSTFCVCLLGMLKASNVSVTLTHIYFVKDTSDSTEIFN